MGIGIIVKKQKKIVCTTYVVYYTTNVYSPEIPILLLVTQIGLTDKHTDISHWTQSYHSYTLLFHEPYVSLDTYVMNVMLKQGYESENISKDKSYRKRHIRIPSFYTLISWK